MTLHHEIAEALNNPDFVTRAIALTSHLIRQADDYSGPDAHAIVLIAVDEILRGRHDHRYTSKRTLFAFFGVVIRQIVTREKVRKKRAVIQ